MKKNIALITVFCALLAISSITIAQTTGKNGLIATIAGISVGDIPKEILLNTGVIECSNPKVEIISFEMSAQLKNDDLAVFQGEGNTLNEEMKIQIKNMDIGYKLVFEQITVKTANGKIGKLNAIILTLK